MVVPKYGSAVGDGAGEGVISGIWRGVGEGEGRANVAGMDVSGGTVGVPAGEHPVMETKVSVTRMRAKGRGVQIFEIGDFIPQF